LPSFVVVVLALLILATAATAMRQPVVVGYLLGGLVLGPAVLGLVTDVNLVERLGAVGVVFLLFFVGLEISPGTLAANWRIAVFGTFLQIALTTGLVYGFGALLGWPIGRCMLLGFVISLSSTAVVLKLLKDWGELDTTVGRDVLGILLTQDVMVVPMLIVLGLLAGERPSLREVGEQLIGGAIMIGLVAWVVRRRTIDLPLNGLLRRDQELQVMAVLLTCFGLALFSASFHLSTALGAFVAGIVVRASYRVQSAERSLEAFRVLFVALFFASVGMLIDLEFLRQYWWQVLALVGMVMVVNTLLNGLLIRALGRSWTESFYAGALLSQIGEFSFVLAAVGYQAGVIAGYSYDATIAVIAISLFISPLWIKLVKILLDQSHRWSGTEAAQPVAGSD
jgi:CPA2 family monovalent cation:H+ antiporter-2